MENLFGKRELEAWLAAHGSRMDGATIGMIRSAWSTAWQIGHQAGIRDVEAIERDRIYQLLNSSFAR